MAFNVYVIIAVAALVVPVSVMVVWEFGIVKPLFWGTVTITSLAVAAFTLFQGVHLWWRVNKSLLERGWLHIFRSHGLGPEYDHLHIRYSAVSWMMIETATILVAVLLVVLVVSTWRHYRREMAAFDARRKVKMQ